MNNIDFLNGKPLIILQVFSIFCREKKIAGLLDLDLKELKNSFFVLSHDLSNISHKVVQQTIFS